MVTLAQLRTEAAWNREIVTPELEWLGTGLRTAFGRPPSSIGTRGDASHLYGAHRSQEWIQQSRWCTNRTYTVQRGLSGDQLRVIAAMDWIPGVWGTASNRRGVAQFTQRIMADGMAGRLPGVFEVIGTLNGTRPVGIDLPEGQVWPASPDHLDHGHLTFDRRRMRDRAVMERVLAAALGEGTSVTEQEVITGNVLLYKQAHDRSTPAGRQFSDYFRAIAAGATPTRAVWTALLGYDGAVPTPTNWPNRDNTHLALASAVTELLQRAVAGEGVPKAVADLADLIRAGGGNPDVTGLVAAVNGLAAEIAALHAGQTALAVAVDALRTEQATTRARLADAFGP